MQSAAVEVADSESMVALADRAEAALGGIDIWVNNAGIYPSVPGWSSTPSRVGDRVMAVNVRGCFVGSPARQLITTAAVSSSTSHRPDV